MILCRYYHQIVKRTVPVHMKIGAQTPLSYTMQPPWCSHKYSPAPENVTKVNEGISGLTCGGDVFKCQIPEQLRGALA